MKRILFLTSTNLTTNPRLLKELRLANHNGYSSTVIKFNLNNWSKHFEHKKLSELNSVDFIEISALRNPLLPWVTSVFLEKITRLIPSNLLNLKYLSFAVGRRSYLLLQKIKKLDQHFDLVIAHNPQAFYPALVASRKFSAKLGIDIEDYHPGEINSKLLSKKHLAILKRILPIANYISYASPEYQKKINAIIDLSSHNQFILQNVFPLSYAVKELPSIPNKPLKLFWFSQYIGKKRGLETILKAMANFKHNEISLTLLGKLSDEMEKYFKQQMLTLGLQPDQVIFMDPVEESSIPKIASIYHIGICSEYAHNENRDLCLTNKLFMYLLSGNALLLSNTRSQQKFLHDNPSIGQLYEQESSDSFSKALKFYIENSDMLYQQRFNALQMAKSKLNWDFGKRIFLEHVSRIIE